MSITVHVAAAMRAYASTRFSVQEPAHFDRAHLALDVEDVEATDPLGIPTGGRPIAFGQMSFLILVDGVVRNELEG